MKAIGKYELIEKIGEGSFGEVWRARDTGLDKEVALKLLKRMQLDNPRAVAAFQREARLAARLEHTNIVQVYGIENDDGLLYIAMQLLKGQSLEQRLKTGGPFSVAQAQAVLAPLAQALAHAHDLGIFHRDIKPANIMLREPDDRPVLTDFGLARAGELAGSMDSGTTGGVQGTHAYIAPELWDGQPASAASDSYALGCVAYQMLTGKLLFGGSTPMAVMRAHDRGPDLSAVQDENAKVALSRALAQKPKERAAPVDWVSALRPPAKPGAAAPATNRRTVPLAPGITLEFVRIPAGGVVMGSPTAEVEELNKRFDTKMFNEEIPQHSLHLSEFWLAQTPTTNLQFGAFVAASGYKTQAEQTGKAFVWIKKDDKWGWHEETGYCWRTPLGTGSTLQAKDLHPVRFITYHDAQAFCAWAAKLTALPIQLPSEAHWERAARGGDARLYPWGNADPDKTRANYNQHIGDTTAAGSYAAEAAGVFDLYDMVGNVWEWTRSLYKPYPYDANDGREVLDAKGARVVRGGAFSDDDYCLRCASRSSLAPDNRLNDLGFRVGVPPI